MSPRQTRLCQLSGSWYPTAASAVRRELQGWEPYLAEGESPPPPPLPPRIACAVVPHAGWLFSGKLAARTLRRAQSLFGGQPPQTVAVLGGHLPPGAPLYFYAEEEWETPLGPLPLRQDYLESFRSLAGPQLPFSPWEGPTNDNTVEVELPLVKHYFPDSSLVALRVPPDESASFLGESLSRLGAEGGLLVVASTDLTHYGPAYAFAPAGLGPAGEKFRRQNDEKFIQAALSLDLPEILRLGNHQRAACSAGAAATAAFIARSLGLAGSLVDHYASADILPGDQSVGYAGIVYGGAAA